MTQRVKNLPASDGDSGLIPGWGRSPGGGNGNPLQYSCLENPMDREPGGLQPMGSQTFRHVWATDLSTTSHNLYIPELLFGFHLWWTKLDFIFGKHIWAIRKLLEFVEVFSSLPFFRTRLLGWTETSLDIQFFYSKRKKTFWIQAPAWNIWAPHDFGLFEIALWLFFFFLPYICRFWLLFLSLWMKTDLSRPDLCPHTGSVAFSWPCCLPSFSGGRSLTLFWVDTTEVCFLAPRGVISDSW